MAIVMWFDIIDIIMTSYLNIKYISIKLDSRVLSNHPVLRLAFRSLIKLLPSPPPPFQKMPDPVHLFKCLDLPPVADMADARCQICSCLIVINNKFSWM